MASTTNERIRHSEGALRHSSRYLENRPGSVGGLHVRLESLDYRHFARNVQDDVAFARTQATVVHLNKEVWDRAAAITEDGRFLAERIEGFIERNQLSLELRAELDELSSEVARIEGRLNETNPNLWYSSIRQTADLIVSEVARVEGALGSSNPNLWYSSIKQAHDSINQTVAILNLDADAPQQFSSIKQTASEVSSIIQTLNSSPDAAGQFSAIRQTAQEIDLVVSTLELPPDHPSQYAAIRMAKDEIDLRVRYDDVISAINLSQEGVRILGNRIRLDGNVEIAGDFRVYGRNITLDGDVEVLGTFKVGSANIQSLSVKEIHIDDHAVTPNKIASVHDQGVWNSSTIRLSTGNSWQQSVRIPTSTFLTVMQGPIFRATLTGLHEETGTEGSWVYEWDWPPPHIDWEFPVFWAGVWRTYTGVLEVRNVSYDKRSFSFQVYLSRVSDGWGGWIRFTIKLEWRRWGIP